MTVTQWYLLSLVIPASCEGKRAMTSPATHFKYICRQCKQEALQPIVKDEPEKTAVPNCCISHRNMAFVGVHNEAQL